MAKTDANSDYRPNPEALLAMAERERRGQLKVFLGAAPGVGKTFAMLQGVRRIKAEGTDVVIGLVETHGRKETAALLEGLEILPRLALPHRDRTIEEFDLDAALRRRPALLIVDELAHSNAPDCRHPKRWQDVAELLGAGINVWTALNIQHLESLADVVAGITRVAIRETVPDKVVQDADEVVLVDIPPSELIERLKQGKVYLPETARRAAQNFFTPGNLTALRELALRRTADRVDDQMVDYLRQNAIGGPWQSADRLMACIGPDILSETVVRATARLATSLNATWVAVHAARPDAETGDAAAENKMDEHVRLAERLGGQIQRLAGNDLAAEILHFARQENITQIVIGRSRSTWLKRALRRSLSDELTRRASDISVQIVTAQTGQAGPRLAWRWPKPASWVPVLMVPVLAVAVAVAIGEALILWLKLPNLSMIFLSAVLFCALRFGMLPAIISAFLSFLAYNFFFIEPLFSFTIAEPHELFALLVFLAVAILTGTLAGRVREQSGLVLRRAGAMQNLIDYSRKMSAAASLEDVLWAAAAHIQKTLGGRIVFMVPLAGELQMRAAWPPVDELTSGEAMAARWAFDKGEAAGWRTGTLPNLQYQFRPLASTRGTLAVCGIVPANAQQQLSAQDERTIGSLLEQTTIAIDRALLSGEAVKAAALEQNESLRGTLLASLSHDLRTPLASITGAVTSLRQLGDKMSAASRTDLLVSIEEEAGRLSRFIANLLDMSRIESGALKARQDWVDAAEVVRATVVRIGKSFPDWKVDISIAPALPFIRGDAQLLEQVLFNLLDNANKYAGESDAVIHARSEGDQVMISVTDEGPGVKTSDLTRMFEKFYRGGRPDGRKAGTGLGLSIARGLTHAMGGTIEAQSPAIRRRGTRIILRFPAAAPGKPAVTDA